MSLDDREEVDALLRELPLHDVSAERADRMKARCLARLRPTEPRFRPAPGWIGWLEPAAALSGSAAYLAAALHAATALLRLGP